MTEGSICSLDTRSTSEMKTSGSNEGDESISLPENLKKILHHDGETKEASESLQGKHNCYQKYSLTIDEDTRREMIESVSEAVKKWDASDGIPDGNRLPMKLGEAQSSFSSPGKVGLRERLEYSLNVVGVQQDFDVTERSDREEEKESNDKYRSAEITNKYKPAVVIQSDSSPKTRHGSQKDKKARPVNSVDEELSEVLKKYQSIKRTPRSSSDGCTVSPNDSVKQRALVAKEQAKATANLFARLTRQARYGSCGRRGDSPNFGRGRVNKIKLHIYDLIPAETVMQLPWGCYFPIGRCFDAVNNGLHSIGTGAYHVGVEINGIEYAYGACDIVGHTGVFSCVPRRSPGYQYRTSIDFGERTPPEKARVNLGSCDKEKAVGPKATSCKALERHLDGREVIKQMATEYMGIDYDLFRKNCVTFASDACIRLGVNEDEIPTWFRNLAESGALTQDVALQTMEPIKNIFSSCEDFGDSHLEDGFEVITSGDGTGVQEVVKVEDSADNSQYYHCTDCPLTGVRKTLSWTY